MRNTLLVKKEAKEKLKNKWSVGIAISGLVLGMFFGLLSVSSVIGPLFLPTLGEFGATFISLIPIFLLWQFLCVPLLYGILRFAWYTALGSDIPFFEVFYYLENGYNYIRSISLGFRIFIRIVLIIAACFAPSLIISAICTPKLYDLLGVSMPYFVSSLWALQNVLEIFGITISVILLMRYFTAPILLINNQNLCPQEALNLSVIISKYANGHTFGFLFSFVGWAILSVFILPLLYTIPLFLVSYSLHCKYLIDNYNRIVDFENSKIYPNYEPQSFM